MGSRVFTLYFRNIPDEYNIEKFTEVFSKFGDVLKLFIHHTRSYGMVEFTDISSCNKAIESLHDTPPLMLHVSMAKPKKDKQTHDTDAESNSSTSSKNDAQRVRGCDIDSSTTDKILYVDRFNKVINVLVDDEGVVYVPIDRVTGVRRAVKKSLLNSSAEDFHRNPDNYEFLDTMIEEKTQRNEIDRKPCQSQQQKNAQLIVASQHYKLEARQQQLKHRSRSQQLIVNQQPGNQHRPTVELPLEKYVQVTISEVVDEANAWVQPASVDFLLEELVTSLFTEADTAARITPAIGQFCLAKFDGLWFRAEVLALSPALHVRYVDYGNESRDPEDGLRAMSPVLRNIPVLAVRARFVEGSPACLKPDSKLVVKVVNYSGGIYQLRLQDGLYAAENRNMVPATSIDNTTFKTITSVLEMNEEGTLELVSTLEPAGDQARFVAACMPESKMEELTKLHLMSADCSKDVSFRPRLGDLVSAYYPLEGWCRAIFLERSEKTSKVALVDFGKEIFAEELRPVPADALSIPWFTCVCSLPVEFASLLRQQAEIRFRVKTAGSAGAMLALSAPPHACMAEVRTWHPAAAVTPVPTQKLSLSLCSGDTVRLISENGGWLYVRTEEGANLLNKITATLSEYPPKDGDLTARPKPAQFVAAYFEDGWYRAVVTATCGDHVNIFYVDYGNEETLPWKRLRILHEELSQMPSTLVKIKLKGRTVNYDFSAKELEALARTAESKAALTATFVGSVESGVTLNTEDGDEVLEKEDQDDGWIVTVSELPPQSLYTDGRRVRVRVLELLAGNTLSFCADDDMASARLGRLGKRLAEYARLAPAYAPHEADEVVAARAPCGRWGRALFSGKLTGESGGCPLFFLDMGQFVEVAHADVRRLPRRFARERPAAFLGEVTELPVAGITEAVRRRLQQLLLPGTTIDVSVLDKDEGEVYRIEIPTVTQCLRSEQLL